MELTKKNLEKRILIIESCLKEIASSVESGEWNGLYDLITNKLDDILEDEKINI